MSMKYVCLAVLVLQTVTNVMLVRRARHLKCSVPVVVLCQEMVKLLSCLAVLVFSTGLRNALSDVRYHVVKDWVTTLKVGVPAFLYVIQNQLLFLALANLDTATYQITYQLKILTTALFSIVLLKKGITLQQWMSLVLLTVGVILVQWRAADAPTLTDDSSPLLGVTAILLACLTSGFAGVFFEMMLKKSANTSIWVRNIQLALCSCVVGLGNVYVTEWDHISKHGVFHDFQPVVIAVIVSQAYGGLLIGLVVKYADNILKVFATSVSILLSSLIAIFYFKDLTFTPAFGTGLILVLSATVVYSLYPYKGKAKAE